MSPWGFSRLRTQRMKSRMCPAPKSIGGMSRRGWFRPAGGSEVRPVSARRMAPSLPRITVSTGVSVEGVRDFALGILGVDVGAAQGDCARGELDAQGLDHQGVVQEEAPLEEAADGKRTRRGVAEERLPGQSHAGFGVGVVDGHAALAAVAAAAVAHLDVGRLADLAAPDEGGGLAPDGVGESLRSDLEDAPGAAHLAHQFLDLIELPPVGERLFAIDVLAGADGLEGVGDVVVVGGAYDYGVHIGGLGQVPRAPADVAYRRHLDVLAGLVQFGGGSARQPCRGFRILAPDSGRPEPRGTEASRAGLGTRRTELR